MANERKHDLGRKVVAELRKIQHERFVPTGDIDLVWVVSGPGTALDPPNSGLYQGVSMDRQRIDAGVNIVTEITAKRMGVKPEEVTQENIKSVGPILFYNGEEGGQGLYDQNNALRSLIDSGGLKIPPDNIVVQTLDEIYTPGQVKGLAKYLSNHTEVGKVAVVTHAPHSRRIGRYIEHHKNLFNGVGFVEACIPEREMNVAGTLSEIRRIELYAEKGDLSKTSIF